MRRFVRWAGIVTGSLVGLLVAGAGIGFAASEMMIRASGPEVDIAVRASHGPEALARGRQLAT
ncbi:MAG TPA: hypothetical protein VIO94_03780, partial [Phenylobacterium sp.]